MRNVGTRSRVIENAGRDFLFTSLIEQETVTGRLNCKDCFFCRIQESCARLETHAYLLCHFPQSFQHLTIHGIGFFIYSSNRRARYNIVELIQQGFLPQCIHSLLVSVITGNGQEFFKGEHFFFKFPAIILAVRLRGIGSPVHFQIHFSVVNWQVFFPKLVEVYLCAPHFYLRQVGNIRCPPVPFQRSLRRAAAAISYAVYHHKPVFRVTLLYFILCIQERFRTCE